MTSRARYILAFILILAIPHPTLARQAPSTIADATRGMERQDGYFPLYWNPNEGTLLLEIGRINEPFLYLTSLATGLGSDRLGLDRGMIGDEQIARFTRVGPTIFLELDNPQFRATTANAALDRSVRESFPTSTIGGFDILAQTGERVLIDVTNFAIRDVMDVRGRLARSGQGRFTVDRARSRIHRPSTKAFPRNTEIEVALTFTSDEPGPEIRRHAADPSAITLREHHSFVALPPPGFRPRPFDPRIGIFSVSFFDYAQPLDQGYQRRYAIRHRLIKRNPDQAVSEPVAPIVYYLDQGVQEPYRTAFIEGGHWYADLFEAAGFRNAFRIEDMPDDMDPLDARYNVIQWVHRTEAGSSIGPSFRDPRTGEIIKAAVRMDSHRSLVDYDIYASAVPALSDQEARGLLAADGELTSWLASLDTSVTAEEFAMARRRQHSAHEIGHTVGLAHNFVAASYGRASVMDYPAPLIRVTEGQVDLRDAYRAGPGAYDSIAIRYAYAEFSEDREREALRAIADEAVARGLAFITNPDEQAAGSYPEATTWINGSDPIAELDRLLGVRSVLLREFDESAIAPQEPMYTLNRRLASVYLIHRFAITGTAKAIGGMAFRYALRGDPGFPTQIVDGARQRAALDLLLATMAPSRLAVPETTLRILAPRPFGHGTDERGFESAAGPAFDQVGIARTLAAMVVSSILTPERLARVVAFHDRDPTLPAAEEIVARLVDGTWGAPPETTHPTLRRARDRVVLDQLIALADDPDATVETRAAATWGVERIAGMLADATAQDATAQAHVGAALAAIIRFEDRLATAEGPSRPLAPPPGTPIGDNPRGIRR